MSKVGILAGGGLMPALGVAGARQRGWDVVVIDVGPEANPQLASAAPGRRIPIWRYEQVVNAFLEQGVHDVFLLGKLPASLIGDPRLDEAAQAVLAKAGAKAEHDVIAAFIADMTARGLRIRSQVELLHPLLVPAGFVVAAGELEPPLWDDIYFGYDVACALADVVDGGQTAVVKNGRVLALEAAEGTDATIRRGGRLGGPGVVVVKVKGRRETDFDLPVIGLATVRAAAEAGAAVLAMEAEHVFLLEREAAETLATEAGLALVAVGGGART